MENKKNNEIQSKEFWKWYVPFITLEVLMIGFIMTIPFYMCWVLSNSILLSILVVAILIVFGLIIIKNDSPYKTYECKNCTHHYKPTLMYLAFSPDLGDFAYIKCPKCGEKNWNQKIMNDEE